LLENLLRSEEVRAFVDQYPSSTYLVKLVERILKAVEKRVTGVVHIVGERLSRYEFAVMLVEELSVDRGLVKPMEMRDAKLVARRPIGIQAWTLRERWKKV